MEEFKLWLQYAKLFAGFITMVGLCFAGWNAWLHGRFKAYDAKLVSLGRLWPWKDDFTDRYNADRLADAKEYALKAELTQAMRDVKREMDEMDRRIETRLNTMDGKLDTLIQRGIN